MARLEGIVHPLVEQERALFLLKQAADAVPLVVFDIPLLYETSSQGQVSPCLVETQACTPW